jgi:hypothetical protein
MHIQSFVSSRFNHSHTPFFLSQVFGVTVEDNGTWEQRPLNELAAEYYQFFDDWLTDHFGGLNSVIQWEKFYIYLADKLVSFSGPSEKFGPKATRINVDQVLVPTVPEIFNVCRLFYQALGGLRNAVPDGQHRMAAMVGLLFGYKIVTDGGHLPPRFFSHDKSHFGLFTETIGDDTEELQYGLGNDDHRKLMSSVLAKFSQKATVRVVVPKLSSEFEMVSERFSRVRTESQSLHKPRVLNDL